PELRNLTLTLFRSELPSRQHRFRLGNFLFADAAVLLRHVPHDRKSGINQRITHLCLLTRLVRAKRIKGQYLHGNAVEKVPDQGADDQPGDVTDQVAYQAEKQLATPAHLHRCTPHLITAAYGTQPAPLAYRQR